MSVPSHFSATYSEARQKFLNACEHRGLAVESYHNPNAKGREGEDLFMDVARMGPDSASKVLFVSSATHGGEGFCGSGIQVNLLEGGYLSELPEDIAVVFIHAINPYGFSHVRRVNEDNIDLNRNFRDYSEPLPDNPAYREVHNMIVPKDWDGPAREAAEKAIEEYVKLNGMAKFQAAVTGGQHVHANGIFYGGKKAAWSNETLRTVSKKHAGDAKHLAMLDIHTGLGPYGYGELIYVGDLSGIDRANEWYDNEVTSPESGTSTSAPVSGTIDKGICEMAPDATNTCVAIEYGTIPLMEVLNALRADNWLYAYGDVDSDLGKAIKKQVRDAFYCDADDWKEMVWKRGIETIEKALKGLEKS
ncbi:M14 family metallopeptidase [Sneathiella glossodoripedis]|uniref:M14 family metallopeptidase n=1 Tax=Sneathiella glossodoripedis TaxID=418853 RepID=UPI00055AF1ED|nr:M14 family metallopeptidase [Sneathiella glossodoripedis]